MTKNLFETGTRINAEYSDYSTSVYDYINQTARPEFAKYREILQDWYNDYPDFESSEFLGRFRSKDNQQFRGAFFELYMHRLFNILGYNIYKTANSCDFKIESQFQKFFLECTLAQNPLINSRVEQQTNLISDRLNILESKFFINLEIEEYSNKAPGVGRIARWLSNKLQHLTGNNASEINWIYDHEGWVINITLIKKNRLPPNSRNMGIISPNTGGSIDSTKHIYNSLQTKRPSRYEIESGGYIVAINSSDMTLAEVDIIYALFKYRDLDYGFFGNSGYPKNTSVSGVLLVQEISALRPNYGKLQYWPNPWCIAPVELPFKTKILSTEKPYFEFQLINNDFAIDLMENKTR